MSSPTSGSVDSIFNSFVEISYSEIEEKEVSFSQQETWVNQIYQKCCEQTTIYFRDSSHIQDNQWKVKCYEDRLKNVKQILLSNFNAFLENQELSCIIPVFEICKENFISTQDKDERFSFNRLKHLRELYSKFFDQLRIAAAWAQVHPTESHAKQINKICYELYTSIDLNQRCFKVLKTFKKFGKKALENSQKEISSKHDLLLDSKYDLIRQLYLIHHYIEAAPIRLKSPVVKKLANSVVGHLNGFGGVSFDPNCQSNPIHILYKRIFKSNNEANDYVAKAIAMGSPTIENGNGIAAINPEFLGYLRYCKEENHRHLYMNHQSLFPRRRIEGDESARCKALHALAEQEEFKNIFYVVTLSQNSWFYEHQMEEILSLTFAGVKDHLFKQCEQLIPDIFHQSEVQEWIKSTLNQLQEERKSVNFLDQEDCQLFLLDFYQNLEPYLVSLGKTMGYCIYHPSVDAFKNEFVAQLFDYPSEQTGQKISPELIEAYQLRGWFQKTMDHIHQIVFENRSVLTLEERRVFIRIAYRNLAQQLLLVTQANNYNTSCKDRIDRGAATDAEDYVYVSLLNNQENDAQTIDFFNTLVFSRAIIVRKRSIIEKRLDRLFETVKFMIDHKEHIQRLEAQLFPQFSVSLLVAERNSQIKENACLLKQ